MMGTKLLETVVMPLVRLKLDMIVLVLDLDHVSSNAGMALSLVLSNVTMGIVSIETDVQITVSQN